MLRAYHEVLSKSTNGASAKYWNYLATQLQSEPQSLDQDTDMIYRTVTLLLPAIADEAKLSHMVKRDSSFTRNIKRVLHGSRM